MRFTKGGAGLAAVLLGLAVQALMALPSKFPPATVPAVEPAQYKPSDIGPPDIWPPGDVASSQFIGPPLVEPFALLDTQVPPGELVRMGWRVNQGYSSGEMDGNLVVLHGVRPGPVLCLTAGIHGDELNGVEIVRRIARLVEPSDLGGTIIAVPVVNQFGFSRNSRYLPDRRDLNRFFPGTRYGSIAARIAHGFFTQVMTHCDALVDFHTGSFERSNLPQLRGDLSSSVVREFTRGFGATPVLHSVGAKGMLRVAATQTGIPAVTFEVGGPGELQAADIAFSVRSVQTLLYRLGMARYLPDEEMAQRVYHDSQWVRSDAGGVLLSQVDLGQNVEKGQPLGVVIDPLTDVERVLVSPVQGRVLGKAKNQVVLPGFAAFHIGEEAASESIGTPVPGIVPMTPPTLDEDDPDAVPDSIGED